MLSVLMKLPLLSLTTRLTPDLLGKTKKILSAAGIPYGKKPKLSSSRSSFIRYMKEHHTTVTLKPANTGHMSNRHL